MLEYGSKHTTYCMIYGKLLDLSVPHYPHWLNGTKNSIYLISYYKHSISSGYV